MWIYVWPISLRIEPSWFPWNNGVSLVIARYQLRRYIRSVSQLEVGWWQIFKILYYQVGKIINWWFFLGGVHLVMNNANGTWTHIQQMNYQTSFLDRQSYHSTIWNTTAGISLFYCNKFDISSNKQSLVSWKNIKFINTENDKRGSDCVVVQRQVLRLY